MSHENWLILSLYFLGSVLGPLVSLWLIRLYHRYCLWQHWKVQQTVAELVSKRRSYPFGLPIAETWSAGEFICEHCGRNGYFSMTKVPVSQLPPELQANQASEPEGMVHADGRASVPHNQVWYSPIIIKCQHCGELLANGDAARAYMG